MPPGSISYRRRAPDGPVEHEAGGLQHPEVLGDGGPADRKAVRENADGHRTRGERFEDAPSRRIAEGVEHPRLVRHHLP